MKFNKLIKKFNYFENHEKPEVAFSVTNFNNKNYAVIREMPAIWFSDSKIKFYELDEIFNEINSNIICRGEDPRIFFYENELFFTAVEWNESKKSLDPFIFNITKKEKIYFTHRNLKHVGKNWTFVKYNNQPFIIYAVDPLVLFKIDLRSGALENFNIDPNSIFISNYRGGTCALQENDKIIGLGHLTYTNAHHQIFYWESDLKKNEFQKITYNMRGVIDPYGFFKCNGKYYTSITSSSREWINANNKYSNEIWEIEI